jgi:hypothetical protein
VNDGGVTISASAVVKSVSCWNSYWERHIQAYQAKQKALTCSESLLSKATPRRRQQYLHHMTFLKKCDSLVHVMQISMPANTAWVNISISQWVTNNFYPY